MASKKSKWSKRKTNEEASDERHVNPKQYGDALKKEDASLDVFGTYFTNDKDADRVFNRELNQKDEERKRSNLGPRKKLAEVEIEDAGVLDMQIVRSLKNMGNTERQIANTKSLLVSGEIEDYERGRLERKLEKLELSLTKNEENKKISHKRLNELYLSKTQSSTQGGTPKA